MYKNINKTISNFKHTYVTKMSQNFNVASCVAYIQVGDKASPFFDDFLLILTKHLTTVANIIFRVAPLANFRFRIFGS